MTDQQLDRLEELIYGFMDDPVGIDEIQAVFAAIAAGPNVVKPGQWLAFLFDEEGAEYPYVDKKDADEFMNLMLALYNETVESVLQETFAPFFRYYEDDEDETPDPVPWCAMFHLAFELHGENTIKEDDDELLQLFLPVAYFLNPDEAYGGLKANNKNFKHSQAEVHEIMIDALHEVVYEVRDYFHPPQKSETGRVLPFDPPSLN